MPEQVILKSQNPNNINQLKTSSIKIIGIGYHTCKF